MKKFDSAKWITENKYGKISEIEKDPDAQVATPKKGEKGKKEKATLDASAITNQTSYGELSGEEDAIPTLPFSWYMAVPPAPT